MKKNLVNTCRYLRSIRLCRLWVCLQNRNLQCLLLFMACLQPMCLLHVCLCLQSTCPLHVCPCLEFTCPLHICPSLQFMCLLCLSMTVLYTFVHVCSPHVLYMFVHVSSLHVLYMFVQVCSPCILYMLSMSAVHVSSTCFCRWIFPIEYPLFSLALQYFICFSFVIILYHFYFISF